MKAVVLHAHGNADALHYVEDWPIPEINDDEVLVRVHATSINRIDIVVRDGYPGIPAKLPHIPGGDIAGVVARCGSSAKHFKEGDRVLSWPIVVPADELDNPDAFLSERWQYFGLHRPGSYAEYVAVPESSLLSIPDTVSFEDAACLPISGLTAYHALYDVAKLKAGQSFLLWGASGGFGTLALQLAKSTGATIIATAGNEEKAAVLRSLGADHVFNHYTDDVGAAVRALFPAGVDCVLDYVGPKTFPTSFALLRKGGKMLLCGMLTGREVTLNIQLTYLRHLSLHGLYLGRKSELAELVDLVATGKVHTHIHKVLPLSMAAEGQRLLDSGEVIGKVVLTIDA